MRHCQMIIRDFLVVFFGLESRDNPSRTLEYLDLRDPNAKFEELEI